MPTDISAYTIRPFLAHEADAYKAIRLEALRTEPGMFGNAYAVEAAYPDEHWHDRVSKPTAAVFGLYHGEELVGLTGIIVDPQKAPDEAYLTQSYIRAPHRQQGLSRMFYDARIAWARERGVKRLIIGHRDTNLASKASILRYGFRYTHSEERLWPDGERAPMLYYVLDL